MATDPTTYTVWILPRGSVRVKETGPVWDFDAASTDPAAMRFTWADAVKSLSEWVEIAQPPVHMEHEVEDRETGEPLPIWGHVRRVFVLTPEEAAAAGIDAPDLVESLYGEVEPGAELATLRADGKVGPTSPGLEAGYIDDRGRAWPLTLFEMTHTAAPRMRDRQPTPQSLLAAALSDDRRKTMAARRRAALNEGGEVIDAVADAADVVADQAAAAADEAPDLAAAIMALTDLVKGMPAAIVAAMGGSATMADGVVEDAAVESVDDAVTLSDARRVAVEAARAELDARDLIAAVLCERVIPESQIAKLSELARRNRPAFDVAVSLAPKRAATTRVGLSDSRPERPFMDRVRDLAGSEGITIADAATRLRKEAV